MKVNGSRERILVSTRVRIEIIFQRQNICNMTRQKYKSMRNFTCERDPLLDPTP